MTTLKDLDDTVSQISELIKELREKAFPNGKPDWMSQEEWGNINGEDVDCPIKLDRIHCQNCYFTPSGKCEYERIMKDVHTQVKPEA